MNPLDREEIYKRWAIELEKTSDLPYAKVEKYRNLILILQTNEILFTKIRGRKIKKTNELQSISRLIMAHTHQLGSSAYHLTKAGFGSSALVLGRSILESLIDLTYLWLCKDIHGDAIERKAWFQYYRVTRYSVITHSVECSKRRRAAGREIEDIFDEEILTKAKKDFEDYKCDFPYSRSKANWAKISSLVKRAQALDDNGKLQKGFPEKNISGFPYFSFEEEYVNIYKHTSEYVHGESSSIQKLLDTSGSTSTIIIGSSDTNIELANGVVANYLLVLSFIFAHINNLELNLITDELRSHGFIIPSN